MRLACSALVALGLSSLAPAAQIKPGNYALISKASDGNAGNDHSFSPQITSNGKKLALTTTASNFGPGTYNGFDQVIGFKRSGAPGAVLSKMVGGQLANLDCWNSRLSKSGRYVAFVCESSLGLSGPPGGSPRVFWRDTKTGELRHVSIGPNGEVANSDAYLDTISEDGRFILFHTSSNNMLSNSSSYTNRGYLHDVKTGTTELVTVNQQGLALDSYIYDVSMSGDARFVFFSSNATNLGFGTSFQIYMRDRKLATTTLVTKNPSGIQGASSSALMANSRNGQFVVMYTSSLNLGFPLNPGNIILFDRKKSELRPIDVSMPGMSDDFYVARATISNDGKRLMTAVQYKTTASGTLVSGIYEFDLESGERWIVAQSPGQDLNDAYFTFQASANGEWVFFASSVDLLESNGKVDCYLYHAH